jgi:GT2 family glycosyltransferase
VSQLLATLPGYLDVEILLIDDGSSDNTPEVAGKWTALDSRVKYHRNLQNLGFLGSANCGAELASKEVILFLNNDTLPRPGWLESLLRVLKEQPEAGAVGGKLVYPDGLLQEAGGIIFSDGEGWNFGRYDPLIDTPVYNYLREVDYCSGALLATWRELFLDEGGFDLQFAPMYYEDVDYCFRLRARGRKVYYQPESVVVHLEGGTAGTDITKSFKRYQAINHKKFVEKWQDALKEQPLHPIRLDLATALELAVRPESPESPERAVEVPGPLTLEKRR